MVINNYQNLTMEEEQAIVIKANRIFNNCITINKSYVYKVKAEKVFPEQALAGILKLQIQRQETIMSSFELEPTCPGVEHLCVNPLECFSLFANCQFR